MTLADRTEYNNLYNQVGLNTNEPIPVQDVIEWLRQWPGGALVDIYEGEGGNWLVGTGVDRADPKKD